MRLTMMPPTRARTSLSRAPSVCAITSIEVGIVCGCMSSTVTGIGPIGGGPACSSLPEQPASSTAATAAAMKALPCARKEAE